MRKYIFCLSLVAGLSSAVAAPVNPEQALSRLSDSGSHPSRILGKRNLSLNYVSNDIQGKPAVYVFTPSGGNGFILAPADDIAAPVLGYSDNGTFDKDNIPPSLEWWMSQYATQIDCARKNGAATYMENGVTREPVEPLLTTRWNQSSPFNDMCPEFKDGRSVTGCVATALAQVINFHKWPETNGTGTHSYDFNGNTYSFDYENTVFDWDNMLDYYDYSGQGYSRTEADAVANLMLASGIGVDMMYGVSASGAMSYQISRALIENFGYDKGAAYRLRDYFSDKDWNDMVYEEIANRRPVIYCGSDPAGGHAFVCDGYSENEFFHFNWGWGGMADGYYMLSALNPAEQGIGGSSLGYGFNSGQDIVTGVQPPVEGSSYFYPLYASGNFTPFPYTDEESGESFYIFGFGNGRNYMIIYTAMELDIATGLRVENLDGEILTYIFSELEHIPGSSGYNILGLTGFGVDYTETGLPEGRYKIYPVVKGEDGDIQLIPTTPTANNFAFMDIDAEGNVSFKIPSFNNKPDISISDFELYTSGTALIPPSYYVTFRNNDPEVTFSGDIDISIYDPSQDVDNDTPLQTDSRKIRIPADSEICITWDFTPVIPVGDYVVVFRSPADEIIGKYPISIVDFPKPSLEAEDIEVPEKFEYNRHNPFAFWLLNNSDIMYSGNVRVEIIDEATMTSHNSTILDTTIKPWDSVELRFYWRINESRDPEGNYLLSFYDKWNRLIGGRSYVFNVTSGIDGITTDEAHKVTVYNMQGLKVAENISTSELPDLGKGVFVVVGPQGSYKISQ